MAGGQGTRLYPLTANRPKPLVEVLGRPVIDYVKDAMKHSGVEEVIVTTGYKGEMLNELIETWVSGDGLVASANKEETPMGTAGSVGLLRDRISQTFIVGSGDSILSSDIDQLIKAHLNSKAKVTIALWEVDDPTQFGIVGLSSKQGGEIDGDLESGFVCQFLEKPSIEEAFSNVINAGLYIIEPEILEHIPKGTKYDFSKELFPKLLSQNIPIFGKKLDGVWFDVGTPSELIRSQIELIKQRDSLPFDLPSGKIVGGNNFVFAGSNTPDKMDGSVISTNVSCAGPLTMVNSLIMENSKIGRNVEITGTIVGRNVTIGDDCKIIDCVIGDNVEILSSQNLTGQLID